MREKQRNKVSCNAIEYISHPLAVRNSGIAGKGVFAVTPIARGDVVIAWHPLMRLSSSELRNCSEEEKHYIAKTSEGYFLLMGEPERYVNHSCCPNTSVQGETDVAIRDIEMGEEITSDYGKSSILIGFSCRCGISKCRGWVGPTR